MGFITIETVINKDKKFTMEFASAGLYTINCGLCKNLDFYDKVVKLFIADDILLVLTEDRDFRNGSDQAPILKANRETNNIDAYDWQGNHLWNIGDIVGDIKMQFDSFHHTSAKEVKKYYGVTCVPSRSIYACISGGFVFLIDVKKRKLLRKVSGRIR
ncbi:MAG: hypothetical protein J6K03_07920 [Oscillospiraceae bacterium]|nr:hypothetical protein [Oscillospiraceae bacterium]